MPTFLRRFDPCFETAPNSGSLEFALVDDGAEDAHQFRVVLSAGLCMEDFHDFGMRPAVVISAALRHGVGAIGDGNNAGPKRNGFARKTVRVSLTVVALVMMADDQRRLLRALGVGRQDDFLPYLAMLLHQLAVVFIECHRLFVE